MKKPTSKKWLIPVIIAVALFLVVAILIPMISSSKAKSQHLITDAIDDIFVSPDLERTSAEELQETMQKITSSKKKTKQFEALALDAIRNYHTSVNASFAIYDLTAQQIMLEMAGYENPEFEQAYVETLIKHMDVYEGIFTFEDLCEEVLEEPITREKIYDTPLTYYTSPQNFFLNQYLPGYFQNARNGDTRALMALCKDLSALAEYTDFSAADFVSIEEILTTLTTDAEKIIVNDGAGGYYDQKTNTSSSNFKKDDALSVVGQHMESTVGTAEFFGDLASYVTVRTGNYSWDDDQGHQSVSDSDTTNESTHLKGEKISNYSVDNQYIKYAQEAGMTNYHKDGYCFGISDTQLVCYVGNVSFVLNLA